MPQYPRLISTIASSLGVASIAALMALPGLAQMMPQSPSTPAPRMSPAPNAPGPDRPLTDLDRQFMIRAAQSDQTEIQTSQLALQRSRNQDVRAFAQHMIQEHTNSSKQLMQIAQQKGVTLPKDVGPDNRPLLTRLSSLSGAAFDRAYMEGQVQAHAKTQAEYQRYLNQGQDPQLRAFANTVLPIVTGHLQMARTMTARR